MNRIPKIDKITAKTIFEKNVFYMITWKDTQEKENAWKPSEYFEQTPFLSSLVDDFEENMKKTEETLFKKLEKEAKRRRSKKPEMDGLKVEDEGGELVWFGSGDEKPTLEKRKKTLVKEVKHMKRNYKEQLNLEEQMKRFKMSNCQALGNKDLRKRASGDMENHGIKEENMGCERQGGQIQEEVQVVSTNNAKEGAQKHGIDMVSKDIKNLPNILNVGKKASDNSCLGKGDTTNDMHSDLRKKKLAVFYELELREKVFDYKNYGNKVLTDLKKFSEPSRSKKLMSIRHGTLFKKIPMNN